MNRWLQTCALGTLLLTAATAHAVPPILSSGPIDRAGIGVNWWASSLGHFPDPSFVADGPTATIVFTARFYFAGASTPCRDVRIDNVCVATNASLLAHTQPLQDPVHFPITQFGPTNVYYWENANPQDVVFLEQFPSDAGEFDIYDLAWANAGDSAQNSIVSPVSNPTGGALELGNENCSPVVAAESTTAIRVTGLTPGETYAVTFWWRSGEADDVLTVDVYGHEDFVDATVDGVAFNEGTQPGVVWADLENDGFPEIYLTDSNNAAGNRLMKNAAGALTDATGSPTDDPADGKGAAVADVDGDGQLELYLGNNGDPNRLFRGGAGLAFVDAAGAPIDDPGQTYPVSFIDYDNNGILDLYIGQIIAPNRLFRGTGGFGFVEVPLALDDSNLTYCASWGDVNSDGDMDLLLGGPGDTQLLLNTGGSFSDISALQAFPSNILVSSADWGDMDNDGDLDLYLGVWFKPNVLLRNDGGTLVDVTASPVDDASSTAVGSWVDYDNDGNLDLHLANNGTSRLLKGDGAGGFTDVTTYTIEQTGRLSWGAAWADVDCDGWMDVYYSFSNFANRLVRNEGAGGSNRWLQVDLEGVASNRSGIGARITVITDAGLSTERSQIREVTGGGASLSMNSLTAEFGLGTAGLVDEIRVRWPSGTVQSLYNQDANQKILMVEGVTGIGGTPSLAPAELLQNAPNPFNPTTTLRFTLPVATAVDLTIYDAQGRRVRSLLSGVRVDAGAHRVVWNGQDERGMSVSSGAYIYTLRVDGFRASRRMVLSK